MALTACDAFENFSRIGACHLREMVPSIGDASRAEEVLKQTFGQLEPHEDVGPAFAKLRDAGITIAPLTNGNASLTTSLLERASLSKYVKSCFHVSQAGAWKPAREPYLSAGEALDFRPESMVLIATPPWDVWGAKQAGLHAAYVNRKGLDAPPFAPRPDLEARTLDAVADRIIAATANGRTRGADSTSPR